MNARQLYEANLIGARVLISATLIEAGWSQDEADAIIEAAGVVPADRERAKWTRYTTEERATVAAAIPEGGTGLPSAAVIRRVAEQVGRTERSVQSLMERLIANPDAGTKGPGRRPKVQP